MSKNSIFRHLKPIVKITLLGLICFQLFYWKGYAPDVAWLTFKRLSPWSTLKDDLSLGGICNALKRYECSQKSFERALSNHPENKLALGNLAIVLTRLGKDDEALLVYSDYFRFGGRGVDVMHSYAESLAAKGNFDKSLYWLYRAATSKEINTEVINSLIDQLMLMNRLEEALSVLASITFGLPDKEVFWKTKFESLKHAWASKWSEAVQGKVKIRIPSLTQNKFYLPILIGDTNKIDFVLINYEHVDSQVDHKLVAPLDLDNIKSARGLASEDRQNTIAIGAWKIKNVPIKVCNECESYLGKSFLNLIEHKFYREDQIDFLELTKPE